ncbi:MAG: XRE family transcriptional regulator [Merismopedia sp. SIO2A8]|nr:XRE family transcriptional regulator [Merismopedia sp. SIO2A8]
MLIESSVLPMVEFGEISAIATLPLLQSTSYVGLVSSLLGLGIVYWRLRQSSAVERSRLQSDLAQLQQESQSTQQQLESQLQQTTTTLQATQRQKAELEADIDDLKQQCARLRESLGSQSQQAQQDGQNASFEQIQTLLTQYPTVRQMAQTKPDLPARNLVALLTSLDNLLQFWGYQPIGQPWESVAYDPQQHQGDTPDLEPGETVYVRFVGYRDGGRDRILIPAKVSRTLPGGVSP